MNCWILYTETDTEEVGLFEEELSDYRWVSAREFRDMDWHADAGYGLPAMVHLENYLK